MFTDIGTLNVNKCTTIHAVYRRNKTFIHQAVFLMRQRVGGSHASVYVHIEDRVLGFEK